MIPTDGFEHYVAAILRLVGPMCVYGQVLKIHRNNRVVRVERRVKIGTASRLKEALLASEDSETLNTRSLSASTSRSVKGQRTCAGVRRAMPVVRSSFARTSTSYVVTTISSGRTGL